MTTPNSPEPLTPAHHRGAAVVLAHAFLDDPGWVAVGPRNSRARWRFVYRTCLGAIRAGASGAGHRGALCGTASRSLFSPAARPGSGRRGLGRLLMREALSEADASEVPAYLWTGNPDNLPYYQSHGFEVIGEALIPGGVPNWFMERQTSAGLAARAARR